MGLNDIFKKPWSKWMEASGQDSDIVLSSRVRLARNFEGMPYPHAMTNEQSTRVVNAVEEVTRRLNRERKLGEFVFVPMEVVPPLERQVLVEKHLISPLHAASGEGRAVVLRDDESVSIMVNEEDHLRIQCLFPGLSLEEALDLADRIDDAFEKTLGYAYCETRGYLTACPTNVGTGMRSSVMMHLPALVITNQAGRVFSAITKLGLVVRGLYGEGTEATGNIFQVSNQITLGQSEEEIVRNLKGVSRQIIEQERSARGMLQKASREQLEDRVCRAYGILKNARIISSDEAMKLISDVRLGVELGLIDGISRRTLNELLVVTRPAYLQKLAQRELGPYDRDIRRAELIREKLAASRE